MLDKYETELDKFKKDVPNWRDTQYITISDIPIRDHAKENVTLEPDQSNPQQIPQNVNSIDIDEATPIHADMPTSPDFSSPPSPPSLPLPLPLPLSLTPPSLPPSLLSSLCLSSLIDEMWSFMQTLLFNIFFHLTVGLMADHSSSSSEETRARERESAGMLECSDKN